MDKSGKNDVKEDKEKKRKECLRSRAHSHTHACMCTCTLTCTLTYTLTDTLTEVTRIWKVPELGSFLEGTVAPASARGASEGVGN